VGTYLERDVRRIINVTDLVAFQTFMGLVAARTGQLVNFPNWAQMRESPTTPPNPGFRFSRRAISH